MFKVELAGNAPREMRDALEACKNDLTREIKLLKLDSPTPETLQKIISAGPGEHQDRLYSAAVRESVTQFFNRLENIVAAHKATYESRKGGSTAETFFS